MQAGEALHICTFHETTLSNLHNSVGEWIWREFHLSLDFPCREDIPILTVMKLDVSFYIYLELVILVTSHGVRIDLLFQIYCDPFNTT